MEGAKSATGAGNLIYEEVELERWGEGFGTSPEYIYITSFPHFHPNFFEFALLQLSSQKKIIRM
jgi:hypothetical protein